MERKEVIVSEQELARQKEFTRRMREMNDRRTRTPLALVDTFGCQQNVATARCSWGMLREMGYELTRDENQADVILLNTAPSASTRKSAFTATWAASATRRPQSPTRSSASAAAWRSRRSWPTR